jgi:glycosyltransferase involved in cell wall biosynthesis
LRSTYQWFYTALNARWEKKAFSQAKVVVAVSEKVAKELIEIGVPPECIRVILNGVDLQEFAPGAVDRQKLGLPENLPLALFAGDIRIARKNLDTVLHALVQVPELHRQDVPDLMKAADFLVFPSRYEPFGLVVLEAMATGLPVVTAATTGAAELVTPECGVVLPNSDDTQALAEAMSHLMKCARQQRHQMGTTARAIAEQHSWANMARNYVDLFEELNQC